MTGSELYRVEAWDGEGRLVQRMDCVRRREAVRMVEGMLSAGLEARMAETRCAPHRRRWCAHRPTAMRYCPV